MKKRPYSSCRTLQGSESIRLIISSISQVWLITKVCQIRSNQNLRPYWMQEDLQTASKYLRWGISKTRKCRACIVSRSIWTLRNLWVEGSQSRYPVYLCVEKAIWKMSLTTMVNDWEVTRVQTTGLTWRANQFCPQFLKRETPRQLCLEKYLKSNLEDALVRTHLSSLIALLRLSAITCHCQHSTTWVSRWIQEIGSEAWSRKAHTPVLNRT